VLADSEQGRTVRERAQKRRREGEAGDLGDSNWFADDGGEEKRVGAS